MGQILRVTLRWSIAWTILGTIAGILMMLAKVPPIAESGAKPTELWFYAFWIPIFAAAAGVVGFAMGLLFSLLMALTASWRTPLEARTGVLGKYGPRILCGTGAGTLLGLLLLGVDHYAIFLFAGFGLCSAVVSCFLSRRTLKA
jgi:hypothetical protein